MIPKKHTFIVKGVPIEFRKEKFFSALHAVERGSFPISPTGFRSLAGFHLHGEHGIDFHDIVTEEFLETLAEEHERNTRHVLANALAQAKVRAAQPTEFIHLTMMAMQAMQYGLFASDEMRRKLWQAAYHLWYLLLETELYSKEIAAQEPCGWTEAQYEKMLLKESYHFRILKRFMSGDIQEDNIDLHMRCCLGCSAYSSLPEKPNGEPVIPPPNINMSLNLGCATPVSKSRRIKKRENPAQKLPSVGITQLSLL